MKSLLFTVLFTMFSFCSFSQRDFTFCYGSIALTIFDGGDAEMVRYNSSGTVVSRVKGSFDLYGKGQSTEVLKIQFQGTEYRYDLIRDGYGNPSKIFDNQGREYSLCKMSKSNSNNNDEDFKKAEERRANEKKRLESFAQYLEDKINNLYLQYKKGMKTEYVISSLHNLEFLSDFSNRLNAISSSARASYYELKKFCDKAELEIEKSRIEAEKKKSDPSYYKNKGFLKSYTNTKGNFVSVSQHNNQIYYLKKNVGVVYKPSFKGYVKDGKIYNADKLEISTIDEKEYFYHVKYNGDPRFNTIWVSKGIDNHTVDDGLKNKYLYKVGWGYYNEIEKRFTDDLQFFYIDSRCLECAIIVIGELSKTKHTELIKIRTN